MALKMSPVSRNLHAKVTLLGLELEDMLFLAAASAGAMLVGQFFFSDRYMFFLPMNWFLLLMVLVIGVPGRIVRQTTNEERERIKRTVEAYLEPVVHEIKVRRADLLGDLKNISKRSAYLDLGECWYVLGQDAKGRAIADPDEVPAECGVIR